MTSNACLKWTRHSFDMNPQLIAKIIGLLLLVSSGMMLPPAVIGMIYQDGDIFPFLEGFLLLALIGGSLF